MVARIRLDRFAEQNEFFKAAGKDVSGIGMASALAEAALSLEAAETVEDLGLQIRAAQARRRRLWPG